MSDRLATLEPPGSIAEFTPDEMIDVRADELIVGRTLEHGLTAANGLLLLAAGSVITPRFFEILKSQNLGSVRISRSDALRATLQGMAPAAASFGVFQLATELTRKLDALVESGSLFVANTGPAVRDRMPIHGRRAYEPNQRETLVRQHREVGATLDGMMRDALAGNRVDVAQVAAVSASYLTHLAADCDSVLTVAREAGRDEELSAHCLQMSLLGMAIGVEMGLDERNVRNIGLCGLVHDWGMVRVPPEIRAAGRWLSSRDFLEIQKHPIYSLELLENAGGVPSVVPLVAYQVHECPNGEGYPRRRKGNSIHLFARILKVADAYAAMTARRTHRPKLMPYAAMEILIRQAQKKLFDPEVVRALLHVVSLFPIGSLAALSNGAVVRVLRSNGAAYTTPVVQVIQRATGEAVDRASDDALIDLAGRADLKIAQALPEPGSGEAACTPDILAPAREN